MERTNGTAVGRRIFGRNNKVWLSGILKTNFEYSHTVIFEKYYKATLTIKRSSGVEDNVVVMLPEALLEGYTDMDCQGKFAELSGEIRIYRKKNLDTGTSHSELHVFVRDIKISDTEDELYIKEANIVYLEGTVSRTPIFRATPMGRIITDLVISVERNPGNEGINKIDHIPCIAWGRTAEYAKDYKIGTRVRLYGRLQSREYFKRVSPDSDEGETRTTYEVSILSLSKPMTVQ